MNRITSLWRAQSLDRLQPSESAMLGGAALLVGLTSGAGVWLFKRLIDLFHLIAFGELGAALAHWGAWTVALAPVLGGLIVGLIVHFFIGEERHHGVAGIMEAVALAGGRLRYQRVPFKAIASALSIGSGASVGPEDPSVQIGSNLGSMFGQLLRLSDERVRMLVAAGAAGGIAAAFNAPIAGVFFALEIVLGEISGNAFGVVVLASVVSAVFTQIVSGTQPAFRVPAYAFNSAWELPLYIGLGLLMESVRVGDVMLRETFMLPTDFPVSQLAEQFLQKGRHGFAVSDGDGKLFGVVSVEDYRRALTGELGPMDRLTVRDIATRDLITAYPDDTLGTALRRMAPRDLSRLPVVERDDPRQLLGVIRRSDAVRAYDVALSRRAAMQHRVHQVRLGAFVASGVSVEEITVEAGAPCEGRRVSEVAWPRECVIATLRRGRQVLIPHGNTVLKAGDVLAVVVEGEARDAMWQICRP